MKKWAKKMSIAITTLLIVSSQANIALARAGGGRGGSLGRSYSGGAMSGGSFSGGGFSGGYSGGGLNGFAFFPFFWGGTPYGGSSSFFSGLISIALILGIIYFLYITLGSSRRTWKNKRSKGHSNYNNHNDSSPHPIDVTGKPITNTENLRRFYNAIQYTRENMNYYAESFTRWDRQFLLERVRQVFFWIQDAWTRQDLTGGENYIVSSVLQKYSLDLENMNSRGERNVIKEPVLHAEDIEFIHSYLGESSQYFVVMLRASMIDYTVDTSGKIIAGEDDNRLYFTEFWRFTWQGDQWVLSEIYQEDALEMTQIARGDRL
ncbi:Tim44-like domain [Desulfitobacterium hafniense]|uniref:Tim44-like domain n=1 Tax=Desulfitobacterium hafniense TaxID=49338 RepID=A0A098B8U1_DESHA|nr:TIM44-like domain-containing protein [Desulfitobacterium hafniense]CDX04792.1 Tim44-like domain [Desulfitobacterium hafniense]